MPHTKIAALLALLVAGLGSPCGAQSAAALGKILGASSFERPAWFKQSFLDITTDVDEATAANRQLILFFHLEGCPYCTKMVEDNFVGSGYTEFLQQNFDIIDIDVRGDREMVFDRNTALTEKELARHLGVRATPTLLFLDSSNKVVLRLNGYRSADTFEQILYFIAAKAYQTTNLSAWLEQRHGRVYSFRKHPSFESITDLSGVTDKPLAVFFEDVTCDACDELYDRILDREDTRRILRNFTVVRLDGFSDARIIGADGLATTPRAYAEKLAMDYRPGVVLFDRGREILRIDGMLRTYHFQRALRYVGERRHLEYPNYRAFAHAYEQTLLRQGQSIDVWE